MVRSIQRAADGVVDQVPQFESRAITPELIDMAALLAHHRLTREQLVDLAILVGTDFNEGIKGIGPKKALNLVSQVGSIENMPEEIRNSIATLLDEIREIFLRPDVTGTMPSSSIRRIATVSFAFFVKSANSRKNA